MKAEDHADLVRVAEAALRAHGPEIGAEQWYTHRDAAEVVVRACSAWQKDEFERAVTLLRRAENLLGNIDCHDTLETHTDYLSDIAALLEETEILLGPEGPWCDVGIPAALIDGSPGA